MKYLIGAVSLVLLLSCMSGALSQQALILADPPTTVDWETYTVTAGAQSTVDQYLDSINWLADKMQASNEPQINAAVLELRTKIHAGHKNEESWARIMLAYRFAARQEWAGCLAELSAAPRTATPTLPWVTFHGTPHGKTVKQLLDDIDTKNQARQPPNDPDIDAVERLIQKRRDGPNPQHELNEGWNRILIAFYIAQGAGNDPAQWQRVKDELDHTDPAH